MTFHTGFDTNVFPGADCLSWLKSATGLAWCGYYLAPAPSHDDTSWMGQRAALQAAGWGLAPIYVGQQTAGPGARNAVAQQGSTDGAHAAQLGIADGFAPGATIYLDWEDGGPPGTDALGYIGAWATAVVECGFQPGIYCSHLLAPTMAASIAALVPQPSLRLWAWRVATTAAHPCASSLAALQPSDPAGCGYAGAALWQFEQNCVLVQPGTPCDGLQVDLSCSTLADPGAPA